MRSAPGANSGICTVAWSQPDAAWLSKPEPARGPSPAQLRCSLAWVLGSQTVMRFTLLTLISLCVPLGPANDATSANVLVASVSLSPGGSGDGLMNTANTSLNVEQLYCGYSQVK